jgi:hypothetical protein
MLLTILLELSFGEIVGGIPHDAGAVVAYLLIGLFVAAVWAGSRGRAGGKEDRGSVHAARTRETPGRRGD